MTPRGRTNQLLYQAELLLACEPGDDEHAAARHMAIEEGTLALAELALDAQHKGDRFTQGIEGNLCRVPVRLTRTTRRVGLTHHHEGRQAKLVSARADLRDQFGPNSRRIAKADRKGGRHRINRIRSPHRGEGRAGSAGRGG